MTDRHRIVRRTHQARVLQAVVDHAPVSRSKLVEITGLSKPTVLAIVNELRDQSLIRPVPSTISGAGRPADWYEANPRGATRSASTSVGRRCGPHCATSSATSSTSRGADRPPRRLTPWSRSSPSSRAPSRRATGSPGRRFAASHRLLPRLRAGRRHAHRGVSTSPGSRLPAAGPARRGPQGRRAGRQRRQRRRVRGAGLGNLRAGAGPRGARRRNRCRCGDRHQRRGGARRTRCRGRGGLPAAWRGPVDQGRTTPRLTGARLCRGRRCSGAWPARWPTRTTSPGRRRACGRARRPSGSSPSTTRAIPWRSVSSRSMPICWRAPC